MTNAVKGSEGKRQVTHEQARKSAQRFIDHWFHNQGEKPTTCVPVEDTDDDVVLVDYITQQKAADSALREELRQAQARIAELAQALSAFVSKFEEILPLIDGMCTMEYVHGRPYTGPTIDAELAEARRVLAAKEKHD